MFITHKSTNVSLVFYSWALLNLLEICTRESYITQRIIFSTKTFKIASTIC